MFCTKCGKELADNAKFCPNCGEQILEVTNETTPQVNEASTTETKKKFSGISLAGFIVSLASIATLNFIAGIVGLILSRKGKAEIERENRDGIKFANAGTALGIVGIIVGVIAIVIMIAVIVTAISEASSYYSSYFYYY